jgi:lipid II:glycine glycyltransferase (peptidoglycan interpeptide bridge formation enzyme)
VVGGLQLLVRSLSRWKITYAVRGPMVEHGRPDIEAILVDEATAYARQHRILYQVFESPYGSSALDGILETKGYDLHPAILPPKGLIKTTLMLDLRTGLDSLMRQMQMTVRRHIRTAEKAGLKIVIGGEEYLDIFRELMLVVCRRRGTDPSPPQSDFFKNLWRADTSSRFVKLFLVQIGEEIVSAAVVFTLGDTARVWKVGWSGAHGSKYPNHFMWWSIIKWAKENSFAYLDFVWIDDHDAKLLATGERRPEAFRDGTTFFKMGFGGDLVIVPPARSQFFHPVIRYIVLLGGMRIIDSRFSRNVLHWFLNRLAG